MVKKKKNNDLYKILAMMAGLVAIFFVANFIFGSIKSFEYEGLTFTKEKFGEIPVFHYYYYFKNSGQIYQYNLYLRNDPRENEIPVEGGTLDLTKEIPLYLSIDGLQLTQCKQSSIAVAGMSAFFRDNFIEVKSATPNIIESQAKNITYATCDSKPSEQVIVIRDGDKSRIVKESNNCYSIEVASCDILKSTEKFITQIIIDERSMKES